MTDTPPRRYKQRDELTIDEELAVQQAQKRGDAALKFETAEYKQARREHLEAGGFTDDNGDQDTPLADQTPDEHFQRIRQGNG